jgi:glyoxylase-like metal-dependent hydrolase (beta-lactamase superfamily II)
MNPSRLKWDVLAKRCASCTRGAPHGKDTLKWVSNSVTLIHGECDAMLVGSLPGEQFTGALVDWIDEHDCDLRYIAITRPQAAFVGGAQALMDHFPNARPIASRRVVAAAAIPMPAGTQEVEVVDLERNALHIVDMQGRPCGSSMAWVPSIGLLVAGDAVYDGTHPYLGDSDARERHAWREAIVALSALQPRTVIVGHGPLAPDCDPRHVAETRTYLDAFEHAHETTGTPLELYEHMLAAYPDYINPGSLWASAHKAKGLAW